MGKAEKSKEFWQECKEKIKYRWAVPFVYVEWKCEQLSKLLEQWAFLDILARLGHLAIIVAVIFYIKGCTERQRQAENQLKAKHYQAWQVINAAQGKPGNCGRIDALQDLVEDKVSLAGIDISKAYLPKLNLAEADLTGANLAEADLTGADFTEANLQQVNLTGAYLSRSNLTEAVLTDANLAEAYLMGANLAEAYLRAANLTEAHLSYANLAKSVLTDANLAGAYLRAANLTEARLSYANLTEAVLTDANLAGAYLTDANLINVEDWRNIKSIELANLYDVNNPPDGFIEWAIERGAVSVEGIEYPWNE